MIHPATIAISFGFGGQWVSTLCPSSPSAIFCFTNWTEHCPSYEEVEEALTLIGYPSFRVQAANEEGDQ